MKNKLKINILPNHFLKSDGTFDKDNAIKLCGKIAGVCYDKEGFEHLKNEDEQKTIKRVNMTLNNGHHSVYDHIYISFNIQNIPKILAMVINNEKEYTTSEKSARYTPVIRNEDSIITQKEEQLYNEWIDIFKIKIKEKYDNVLNDSKILKLAQENARYLVTIFMPTQMIYTTSLRQINYIVSWMKEYILKADINNNFEKKLSDSMKEFIDCLTNINVIEPGLLNNEKHRSLSLFGKDLQRKDEYFGDVYSTTYKGSFAQLAQAQRHRTLDYEMEFLDKEEYFVPPIIQDDETLKNKWLNDISSVKDIIPQGQIVRIYECGKYNNFILKCKERLCSAAQLEIMMQTKETLLKYKKALENNNSYLVKDIKCYCEGSRCTFSDFKCNNCCNFKEGILLTRKI